MSDWYLRLKNQESGPFKTEDLLRLVPASKRATALVRSDLDEQWRPLTAYPELVLALDGSLEKPAFYKNPWFALLLLLSLTCVALLLVIPSRRAVNRNVSAAHEAIASVSFDVQSLREHQDLVLQQEHEARKAELEQLTAEQRRERLAGACANTCDEADLSLIVQAAGTADERASLEEEAKSLLKVWLAKSAKAVKAQAMQARVDYAQALTTTMLNRHMNPRSVEAAGVEKKQLLVQALFCDPRFIHDAESGDIRTVAKSLGFKKIICKSREETWSTDL